MLKNSLTRLSSLEQGGKLITSVYNPCRLFSEQNDKPEIKFNDQQASYYTAKDIEFCPNRAKEVMQNHVQETSQVCSGDEAQKKTDSASENEKQHIEGYQSGSNVSLYSVMQSNVPEPFTTKNKAPSHLNMPGSSSSQGYKYLSGKMQSTHQSER